GQGKRLLPLTEKNLKCLLPVRGDEPILGWQLAALARAGIERAVVVIGFGAERVEAWMAANPVPGLACETLINPFYRSSDNLISCWLARRAMSEDFPLLRGDHICEGAGPAPLVWGTGAARGSSLRRRCRSRSRSITSRSTTTTT